MYSCHCTGVVKSSNTQSGIRFKDNSTSLSLSSPFVAVSGYAMRTRAFASAVTDFTSGTTVLSSPSPSSSSSSTSLSMSLSLELDLADFDSDSDSDTSGRVEVEVDVGKDDGEEKERGAQLGKKSSNSSTAPWGLRAFNSIRRGYDTDISMMVMCDAAVVEDCDRRRSELSSTLFHIEYTNNNVESSSPTRDQKIIYLLLIPGPLTYALGCDPLSDSSLG